MRKKVASRLSGLKSVGSVAAILSLLGIGFVFFWHIGTQPAAMSPAEAANITTSHSLHSLYAQPLFAPHNFLQYLLIKLHHGDLGWLRAVSAVWGLVFCVSFFKIVKTWFGVFIGWLATVLFATSPLVILAARSADASVMYLMPVAVASCYFWLTRSEKFSHHAYFGVLVGAALCLYTPGSLWILIVGVLMAKNYLLKFWSARPRGIWTAYVAVVITLAPLLVSLAAHPHLIKQWLALPAAWHLIAILKSIGWMMLGIFWRTNSHYDLQVGQMALVSTVQIILAVLGLFALWQKARSKSFGITAIILAVGLFAGLSNQYAMLGIVVASVCVAAAAGLRYLHLEWQSVFPLNPLPRALALVLICSAVMFNVFYGIRYSLVAWPHSVATRQTYVLK